MGNYIVTIKDKKVVSVEIIDWNGKHVYWIAKVAREVVVSSIEFLDSEKSMILMHDRWLIPRKNGRNFGLGGCVVVEYMGQSTQHLLIHVHFQTPAAMKDNT